MIKKILKFAAVAVLAAYFYWPYYASQKFLEAINSKDLSQIDKWIDWEKLNKDADADRLAKAKDYIEKTFPGQGAGNDAALEATLGPRRGPTNSRALLALLQTNFETRAHHVVAIESRSWTAPWEMSVRFDGYTMQFRLANLTGWKFTGIPNAPYLDGDSRNQIHHLYGPPRISSAH